MSHPPILIVDENDKPIGSASMTQAQEEGAWHRIVRIMIEDGNGNLLLQKRAKHMEMYPECWDNSAAGHVDVGEEYLIAAEREANEETGISGKLEPMGTYKTQTKFRGNDVNRFNRVYKIVLDQPAEKFTIDPEEVAEVKWFSVEDVKKLITEKPDQVTDGLVDVISKYY